MPIGSELNETLPEVGDSAPVAAARIIDTLERLVEAVEAQVPSSAVDVDADFDMQGHGFTDTGSLGLANLADTDDVPTGHLFRFENNLWFVHPDGAFQLTAGDTLNISITGGIGGDYGGSNPALVSFSDATASYLFYDDASSGAFADVECDDLAIHNGTANSVRFEAHSGVSGTKTLTYMNTVVPGAGTSVMTVNSSGQVSNNNDTSITDDLNLSSTAEINHGTWKKTFCPPPFPQTFSTVTWAVSSTTGWVTNGSLAGGIATYTYHLDGFQTGDVIGSLIIRHDGNLAGDDITVIEVFQGDALGSASTTAAPSPDHVDNIGTSAASTTVTLGSPISVADGDFIILKITVNAASVSLGPVTALYTHA